MSCNIISFVGVVGASGHAIFDAFDYWQKRSPNSTSPSLNITRESEKLLKKVLAEVGKPPVIFYRSYVDTWSFPTVLLDIFLKRHRRSIRWVDAGSIAICIPLRVMTKMKNTLALLRKSRRIDSEMKWFLDAIDDCHSTLSHWKVGVVIIRFNTLGLSVDDSEIRASIDATASWL